jgi:hypothetical protein
MKTLQATTQLTTQEPVRTSTGSGTVVVLFLMPSLCTHSYSFTSWKGVYACYGKEKGAKIVNPYRDSPIVCSGSTVATRKGMLHYLTVIVDEYYALVEMGESCIPPNIWDQGAC